MDKTVLAIKVREAIMDLSKLTSPHRQLSDLNEEFLEAMRKLEMEKLVLFSGALAALVLDEGRKRPLHSPTP